MWSFLRPEPHRPLLPKEQIDPTYKRLRVQVFIGIFIGYAGYYLVRKNFALAMPYLVEMGFDKGLLGVAISANAIAYGLSKFLMGGVSDRSSARKFLPLGLTLSALTTLILGTRAGLSSVVSMFILQFLIGWFQGMGWPPSGRVMTHWFSQHERGTKMSIWNVAHNVGGALIGPMAAVGMAWFGSWQAGTFWFPASVALVIVVIAYLLIRDTPQSCGLPPIEQYRNDYPPNYSAQSEVELTAKLNNIPVRLLNTMQPDAPGTLISNAIEKGKIKAVAAKDNITSIKIKSGRMLLATGFLRKVFETFENYQTPIDMVTTSEVGVSVTIDNRKHLEEIVDDLKKYGTVTVDEDMVIVCVVGDLEWDNIGFEARIVQAMKDVPVRMISYGGSNYNVSLLIKASDKQRALQALSDHLFNN